MKFNFGNALATALIATACLSPAAIAQSDTEKKVNSIRSVAEVKKNIRESLEYPCPSGFCVDDRTYNICERVAALDVQVNGKIIGASWSGTAGSGGKIPITKADLALMKLIFSQCKPTNYLYSSYDSMLHVVYHPTPEADRRIRRALGVR